MVLADPSANIESNFLVRRAGFKIDGLAYHSNLQYKIELGLSNRDMSGANEFNRNTPRYILDSIIKWKSHDGFTLIAGQTKLPGNIEFVVSSENLQFIDRSLLNSKFNTDRDIGTQLHHVTQYSGIFITRGKVDFSQVKGRNLTEANLGGYQYTVRLEALPFERFAQKEILL